ncbi:MAG TPA: cyclic nucleotide-binding and patatin-like phospholipase domain-containing protein, partial [Anaerolineae bacterium]
ADADSVYALVNGRLIVKKETEAGLEMVLESLEEGSLVGQLEVWTGQTRAVTVQAERDSRLVQVSMATFKRWLRVNPDAHRAVATLSLPSIRYYQLADVLGRLFAPADATFLPALIQRLTWHHFANGETVFRQGDGGRNLYLVVNGHLRLQITDEEGQVQVAGEVHSGEMAGEYSVLANAPHATTGVAVRESNVVALAKADFQQLCAEYPQTMLAWTLSTVQRRQATALQAMSTARRRHPNPPFTIALVPATPDVDLASFAHHLAGSLSAFGPARALTQAQFDADYGQQGAANMPPDHPAHPLLVDWMNNLETKYRHLLYAADATWTEWTRRSLRQADRVLIVANAANDPEPSLMERAISALPIQARVELVLLHGEDVERPRDTARWLAPRRVYTHHHVRRHTPAHYQRLARRLAGNPITLVLSGGGARGFAHLGIFRALQELNIPVDMIGGTSIGALMGATLALDWTYEQTLALSERFANPRALFDYTLPLVSFFASGKVTNILTDTIGDRRIEDLWRPYFAVSANLTRADIRVHQSGPLWRAVRASISIPGIFTPVLDEDGEMLVDGGVANNFPVDLMRPRAEGGQIIGVHLDSAEASQSYDFGPALSGWQVLWRRVNPFTEPIAAPSLFGYLVRAATLNSAHHNELVKQQTDVLIEPDVRGFGLLDFEKYRDLIEVGHQSALPILSAWRDSQSL